MPGFFRFVGMIGVALLCALALPAQAQTTAEGILVLGLKREGHFDPATRAAVQARLGQMPAVGAVHTPRLSTAELSCTDADCLDTLGRTYNARWILGGQIGGSDDNYVIDLWLFDGSTQALTQTRSLCKDCGADQLAQEVARAAGNLVEQPRRPPEQPLVPPPQPPLQKPRVLCPPSYYTFKRGLAIGATSTLLLAGMATGFALTGLNGQEYDSGHQYHLNTHMALSYGLSVVPAGALAVALLANRPSAQVPQPPQCLERPATRWSFRRGLAIGAFSSALLTSLITSVTLGAMDGRSYNSATHYSLRGAAISFGVTSAAWAVGLGLSIGL